MYSEDFEGEEVRVLDRKQPQLSAQYFWSNLSFQEPETAVLRPTIGGV